MCFRDKRSMGQNTKDSKRKKINASGFISLESDQIPQSTMRCSKNCSRPADITIPDNISCKQSHKDDDNTENFSWSPSDITYLEQSFLASTSKRNLDSEMGQNLSNEKPFNRDSTAQKTVHEGKHPSF